MPRRESRAPRRPAPTAPRVRIVPAPIEPPALADLVDLAERPRATGWSLRAALVRYAQPEPVRASLVLEQVRRVDAAVKAHAKLLAREGPAVWAALDRGGPATEELAAVVALLDAARPLDALGDLLAAWATDPSRARPDAEVDDAVARTADALDALGVARERRQGQRARPGGGRRARG